MSSHLDSLGLGSLVSEIRIEKDIACPWDDVGRTVGVMTLPVESAVFERQTVHTLLAQSRAEGEETQWALRPSSSARAP